MRRISLTFMLCLAALVSASGAGSPGPEPATVLHDEFDRILRAVVMNESVDYAAVRARHLGSLDRYLDRISRIDPDALPEKRRLALYINLYNATAIREVVRRFEPGYTVARDSFAVFDDPTVRVGGETYSLNQLENDIIRPRFREPRIHVALVCAARSCPPLIARAYRSEDLDEVLEENMRRFVNDPSRNRIDPNGKRLELSQIFEWYAVDFGGRDGLARYIDGYTGADVAGFEVTFVTYSWALNDAAGVRR